MTPARRPWPTFLAVALLALLPTAVLLVVSYRGALRAAQAETDDTARRAKRRVDELFAAADDKLRGYARDVAKHPADARREWLDRLVYNDSRFREAGEIDAQGRLALTDRGPRQPPDFVPADQRPNPADPKTQLIGRFETLVKKEESIVLSRPTGDPADPRDLRSVNLLVKPDVLTDPFAAADLGPTGYLAFARAADGQLLDGIGAVPRQGDKLVPGDASGRLRGEAVSADGAVRVVAEVSTGWAARHWSDQLAFGLPLTVLTTLGLLWLARGLADRRRGLDYDLQLALVRNEFEVHYQPVVELPTGRWVGAEALLRWNHPTLGRVRPDLFIPVAEETGLIDAITAWVLRRAGEELAPVLRQKPTFYLSVNLPPAMLANGRASRILDANPVGSPLTPDRLVFELTERQLLDGPAEEVAGEMLTLTERGVRFGLDDFGTGYSSLSYLHKFRFDILKIDKSFLPGPDRSEAGVVVLKTLIDLGTQLGLTLIAEGVEQPAQADLLKGQNVKYAQGWLFCRALPAADFLDRLKLDG